MRQTARPAKERQHRASSKDKDHEHESILEGEALLGHLELKLDEGDPLDTARGFFNGVVIGAILWLVLAVAYLVAVI